MWLAVLILWLLRFLQALALDPHCVFAHALLAEVYEAQATVLTAGGAMDNAARARRHAAEVLDVLQRLDPLRAGLWARRGAATPCVSFD